MKNFRMIHIIKIIALSFFVLAVGSVVSANDKILMVYNWTEYMPDSVLTQFTRETGIEVRYSTYESNEAMYAKVKLVGEAGYDIIVPSTYFINKMRMEGMLTRLDHAKLPNLKNIYMALLNKPYDPNNQYSVPYMWGGTGIILNKKKIKSGSVTSWGDLWDPRYKGYVLLQDDLREVFAMALLLNGNSINSTDPEHIRLAYERLTRLMPSVRVFNSDNPKMPFLNEEVSLGMIWNGEAFQAMTENPDLEFIWHKEGGIFWTDCMAIPKNAHHVEAAHRFIDFIMRPDIAAAIATEIGYASPNQAALKLLPKEVKDSKTAYPPLSVMENSEFQNDIGDAIVEYEKYWEKLKTGK